MDAANLNSVAAVILMNYQLFIHETPKTNINTTLMVLPPFTGQECRPDSAPGARIDFTISQGCHAGFGKDNS